MSLDTTAVLVTPVVVSLARHAKIHPLPFALGTVWLANTASLLLAMGLFLIVQTLHDHGLGAALARVSGSGYAFTALLQLAGVGALAANGVNNLPAYLVLEPVAKSPVRLAALLIGVNLGPLISPWASLATLLWHSRLHAMGISISWRGYALAGLAVVAVMLPLAVLALWLAAGMPA